MFDGGSSALDVMFAAPGGLPTAGKDRMGPHTVMAFGLANLAWASGQAVAASLSGALAQATSDFVPYALLAAILLGTLVAAQRRASSGG